MSYINSLQLFIYLLHYFVHVFSICLCTLMINRVISYSTSSYAMIQFPLRKFDLSFSTQTFLPMQSYYQPLIIHSHNNPLLQIILNMASAIIPSVNKGQELTPFFPQNETALARVTCKTRPGRTILIKYRVGKGPSNP